jgi:hypothetical protein
LFRQNLSESSDYSQQSAGSIQQEQQSSAAASSMKVKNWRCERLDWLGGLDSNQDSQSQSLESYQLDDLPAGRNKNESQQRQLSRQPRFNLSNLIGNAKTVNQSGAVFRRQQRKTIAKPVALEPRKQTKTAAKFLAAAV